jgi:hypothetical protein
MYVQLIIQLIIRINYYMVTATMRKTEIILGETKGVCMYIYGIVVYSSRRSEWYNYLNIIMRIGEVAVKNIYIKIFVIIYTNSETKIFIVLCIHIIYTHSNRG